MTSGIHFSTEMKIKKLSRSLPRLTSSFCTFQAYLRLIVVLWINVLEKSSLKREVVQSSEGTLPYWVAALIQQQTAPKRDHLSPLWSHYKSSTFPLFSSAARKLIKLAFPCCLWQMESEAHPVKCIVGGRRGAERWKRRTQIDVRHSARTESTTRLLF
ncbi:uncharacterized protein V6R79_020202 [Siganus canaliculatus]